MKQRVIYERCTPSSWITRFERHLFRPCKDLFTELLIEFYFIFCCLKLRLMIDGALNPKIYI